MQEHGLCCVATRAQFFTHFCNMPHNTGKTPTNPAPLAPVIETLSQSIGAASALHLALLGLVSTRTGCPPELYPLAQCALLLYEKLSECAEDVDAIAYGGPAPNKPAMQEPAP